ncbi:hypothetical protein FD755_018147 [Muntiacus reevesi]|uniref:Uncharacterized protein n=2 Tax=Muntiacus TaxID=9885 RepID=A0A5N3X908_MUNRE|nr:hypothetical protein FD754_004100 [Muntiacus muntjak]KAB0370185.1 hypothetical protein FD755_018147 [Muntiacus reevesi]
MKNFQSCISFGTDMSSEYSMDKAMVEFAMTYRELNHYLKANKNSNVDFQNNEKFVQFKQQLKELKKQYGLQADRMMTQKELMKI